MPLLDIFKSVPARVLNTRASPPGRWRSQVVVEASRVRGEVVTPWPPTPGERLLLRPSRHHWTLAPLADRP